MNNSTTTTTAAAANTETQLFDFATTVGKWALENGYAVADFKNLKTAFAIINAYHDEQAQWAADNLDTFRMVCNTPVSVLQARK